MFRNRLSELRKSKGYNMKQTAAMLNLPYTTYVGYEKGEREPDSERLILLSNFFNCSIDYLIYRSDNPIRHTSSGDKDIYERFDNIRPINMKRFPLLGEIACGNPISAQEDHGNYVLADADIHADFCLKAKGDSMVNADIHDGDVIFIRQQDVVENGEIAAVIIEDEATLKRVYYDRENNRLQLVAENPHYAPLVYMGEELNYIRILGKAVTLMRKL